MRKWKVRVAYQTYLSSTVSVLGAGSVANARFPDPRLVKNK